MTLDEIIKKMDKKNIDAKRHFITYKDSDRKKAGVGAKEYRQSLKDNPPYGLGLESKYLNTIFRGANRKKFMLESRGTGCGKSRSGIGRIANFCSKEIYSVAHDDFIPNPNGLGNGGLYIGTEMGLLEEVEPILWSIVAGVDQDKIMNNTTTQEEDMRIDKAIEIIEQSCMHLIYEPNFNSEVLEQHIEEYKLDYNIGYSFFDYIMITDELVSESSKKRGGLSVRDDVALLQLSADLKRMTKDYDIFLQSCTQISGDWKNSDNRDSTILRGSRVLLPN
jgi:replicative DNA helicase